MKQAERVMGMGCLWMHWACGVAPMAAVEVEEGFSEERALS